MQLISAFNLAIRFLLELGALIAISYWGFTVGSSAMAKVVLGVGVPLSAATAWGLFGSPKAPMPVDGAARLGLEVIIFAGAIASLYAAGRPLLAAVFGVIIVINRGLVHQLRP